MATRVRRREVELNQHAALEEVVDKVYLIVFIHLIPVRPRGRHADAPMEAA